MAMTQSALAHAVARDLVRAAPSEAGIKRVWVWSQHGYVDPERDYVELAVLHDELDEAMEQRFVSAIVKAIDGGYPDVNKSLHTFTLSDLDGLDPEGELRPGAEEVDLTHESNGWQSGHRLRPSKRILRR
jgi:hypothetical protein